MSHSKLIPFTISYEATKDHGDTIYVAGTFTRPEWSLQEMQRQEQDGQGICYHTKITIEPSKEHQYRLKLGLEGDWIVDENKPIVTSVLGTKSNIIRPASETSSPSSRRQSTTRTRNGSADAETPLFAHERLSSQDLSSNSAICDMPPQSPQPFDYAGLDLNDPTIEDFPCDRGAIMGTLRKIRSSHSDSGVVVEDSPGHGDGPRSSLDSDEGSVLSAGQLSPSSIKRRENRLSSGSAGRNRSANSLGAIAEEPGARRTTDQNSEAQGRDNQPEIEINDDGEALMMRNPKA